MTVFVREQRKDLSGFQHKVSCCVFVRSHVTGVGGTQNRVKLAKKDRGGVHTSNSGLSFLFLALLVYSDCGCRLKSTIIRCRQNLFPSFLDHIPWSFWNIL